MVSDSDRENTPLEYPSSENDPYTEREEQEGTDPIPFAPEILDIMEQHGLTPEDFKDSFTSDEDESGNPTRTLKLMWHPLTVKKDSDQHVLPSKGLKTKLPASKGLSRPAAEPHAASGAQSGSVDMYVLRKSYIHWARS
jgi:hypothetical protein